jgi:hypothetical protein
MRRREACRQVRRRSGSTKSRLIAPSRCAGSPVAASQSEFSGTLRRATWPTITCADSATHAHVSPRGESHRDGSSGQCIGVDIGRVHTCKNARAEAKISMLTPSHSNGHHESVPTRGSAGGLPTRRHATHATDRDIDRAA